MYANWCEIVAEQSLEPGFTPTHSILKVILGDVINPTQIIEKTWLLPKFLPLEKFNNRGTIETISYSIHFQKLNQKMINYRL